MIKQSSNSPLKQRGMHLKGQCIFQPWPKKCTGRNGHLTRYLPKRPETSEMTRNTPKFYPSWNERLPRTDLHTGTTYSARSGRNGTESITLRKRPVLKNRFFCSESR